jgi:type II protein arginine methyltransferase
MSHPVLARYPQVQGHPLSMAMLCTTLLDRGFYRDAFELGLAAVSEAPGDLEVRDLVASTLGRRVPKWHIPMLHDQPRNACYAEALRRVVRPGMIVLEIGTGAGFLSLTAARLGARVYSCEANPMVAAAADHIARKNGLDERITVIPKLSSELVVGRDIPEPADLLMSELFDDTLFGDGIVEFIGDAKARLLKAGAAVVPRWSELRLALVDCEVPQKHRPLADVDGFDLSPFNVLAPRASGYLRVAKIGARARSEAASALRKDFQSPVPFGPDKCEVELTSLGGAVGGIAQWLRVEFADDLVFENDPFEKPGSHWGSPVTPFKAPIATRHGEALRISVRRLDRELSLGRH